MNDLNSAVPVGVFEFRCNNAYVILQEVQVPSIE